MQISRKLIPIGIAAGVVLLLLAAVTAIYYAEPGKSRFLPPCLFLEATHLYCPGCGNTRALHALLHGELLASLRCNILLLPGVLTAIVLLWKPKLSMRKGVGLGILAIVLGFAILRNLPMEPFCKLAPHSSPQTTDAPAPRQN
ncbi:MAG: DUF2752 domain-containing protein [Victivallaceae bacterium]|nr:DUF2752 domain-containing protein [Victivallaceae bacterium]